MGIGYARLELKKIYGWKKKKIGNACTQRKEILKEIDSEYSLEGLMLKLKLQYFGHLMQRTDSLEKTLMLGKIKSRRRRGWQRTRSLDGITDSIDMSLSKLQEWWWTGKPGVLQSMGSQRVRHDWATELNWTSLVCGSFSGFLCFWWIWKYWEVLVRHFVMCLKLGLSIFSSQLDWNY